MAGIPLLQVVPDAFLPAALAEPLSGIGVTDFRVREQQGDTEIELSLEATDGGLEIALAGADGVVLVLEQLGTLTVRLSGRPRLRVVVDRFTLRLPRFMRPATKVAGEWQAAPDQRQELTIASGAGVVFELDAQSGPRLFLSADPISAALTFDLAPTMLGESGVVISGTQIGFGLDEGSPTLRAARADVHLPDDIPAAPDLHFEQCVIGRDGFTGTVIADWDLDYDTQAGAFAGEVAGELFGVKGGLRRFGLTFENNALVGSDIQGVMKLPYFEAEPIDVRLNILGNGSFTVTLLGLDGDGITLTKAELLALHIRSIKVGHDRDAHLASLVVSGSVEPLLMASDGLEWPRLDVADLTIEQDTSNPLSPPPPVMRFREAWLDLKDLASLDLWGFHFELNRVGIGYDEPVDKLWVDLTGSLRLIEQLPVGLAVEGFRVTWPRRLYEELGFDDLASLDLAQALSVAERIEVKFDGVHLFYGIPEAVEFEGFIRFIKEAQKIGFAGDVILRVPPSGFSAEAGLMVGMNFEDPPYPFLYVYFGLELPKGIPLGQSGLALKGAMGLFGLNVTPDKTPEQNWYYDWYKRGPIVGAHPTNKWRDERIAIALGGGVTITTTDGYLKGVKGLFVLAIPGPIIVLEGRSLILDGLGPSEPPLRAVAVFDGREHVVQFNVEAEAEVVADLAYAYGMLEAFFDFDDLTNWHLYLGQDQPEDRRIRASVLKLGGRYLFDANAYLMIDMVGAATVRSRMGIHVGFEPKIPPLGPVTVALDAVLDGQGVVTILPEQFSGELALSGTVALSAFGFSVTLTADADMMTEGPQPFSVDAALTVSAALPTPLDDVEATLTFHWESPPRPDVVPPLAGVVVDSDYASGGGALQTHAAGPADARQHADGSPVVPLDAVPTLLFGHDTFDHDASRFARDSSTPPQPYHVGLLRFSPSLVLVELYRWRRGAGAGWELLASSNPSGGEDRVPGLWLADAVAEHATAPAARRLQLWGTGPFPQANVLPMPKAQGSYADTFLADFPDYYACGDQEARLACVGFQGAAGVKLEAHVPWGQDRLIWTVGQHGVAETDHDTVCLQVAGGVRIRFPEPVAQVVIRFCQAPGPTAAAAVALRRPARTPSELEAVREAAEAAGETPEFERCHVAVERRVSVSGLTWTLEGKDPFRCVEIPGQLAILEVCYVTVAEMTRARFARTQCQTNQAYLDLLPTSPPTLDAGAYYKLRVTTRVKASLSEPAPGPLGALYARALGALTGFDDGGMTFTEEASSRRVVRRTTSVVT